MKKRHGLSSGILFIIFGFTMNPWSLTYLFSDGQIDSAWKTGLICCMDALLILTGILIIRKKIKIPLRKVGIITLFILFLFFLTEMMFRLFFPFLSPADQLFGKPEYYIPKPFVMYGGKPGYEGLNRLGYKENAPAKKKNSTEFRIFILGGSAVFEGLPTISKLLQEEFHHHGLNSVRCFNFGLPASTSGMELSRIVFEISNYQPDLIIMYNGTNDLLVPLWADPRPGYPFNYFLEENNPLLKRDVDDYPMLSLLLYESKLLRYLIPGYFTKTLTRFGQIRKETNYRKESWKKKIADTYIENMIKAGKVARGLGCRLIIFFQPVVYFKDSLNQTESGTIKKTRMKEYFINMHARIFSNQGICSLQQDSLSSIVDLSNMFDTIPNQVFTDDVHTLQSSKPIIAKELYKKLIQKFGTNTFR